MRGRTIRLVGVAWLLCASLPRANPQSLQVERVLLPLPAGTGSIAGVVLTDDGQPAAGAAVSLRVPAYEPPDFDPPRYAARQTTADASGRFAFDRVTEATLELAVSMPGFLAAVYGQVRPGLPGTPIRLKADQALDVSIRLSRGSSIAGAVFDSQGIPASGIPVHAFRMEPLADDEALMGTGGSAVTDERGEFRIADLAPGTYTVTGSRVWSDHGPAPIRQVGPEEFVVEAGAVFRDVLDARDAEQFSLGVGEDRRGIDLRLRMTPVTTVNGIVRGTDGQPQADVRVRLVAAGDVWLPISSATTAADGRFVMTRVPKGNLELLAHVHGRDPMWGSRALSSDGRTPTSVSVDLRRGATVTGTVVYRGKSTAPAAKPYTFFFARALGSSNHDVPEVAGNVDSPKFIYRGVPPGRYVIRVNRETLPAGWRMQSEMVDGRDALDFPFAITSTEPKHVVITLSDQVTELSGVVIDASGATSVDHTVVVFAADERFWTPGSRRIRTVRPDSNGFYRVRGLPAGDYVVALADPAIYGRPPSSLLRELRATWASITLEDGETRTVRLLAPVR